jgi:hypothetical protein
MPVRRYPPEFEVDFRLELSNEVANAERAAYVQLSDADLLAEMVQASREILLIADPMLVISQLDETQWDIEEVVPINPDLQACLLWHLAAEALGLATLALERRASATALAQVRAICDAYCLLRWLKEPEDDDRRRARTLGLVLSELDDAIRVYRSLPGDAKKKERQKKSMQAIRQVQEGLIATFADHDVEAERPPETARALYETYFSPGYGVYAVLSDIGSHVGLRFLREFFREGDGPSYRHRFDFVDGGLRPRCFYLGVAYGAFLALAEVAAWYFGFEEGLRADVQAHFAGNRGLLIESQHRIDEYWLGKLDSDA